MHGRLTSMALALPVAGSIVVAAAALAVALAEARAAEPVAWAPGIVLVPAR